MNRCNIKSIEGMDTYMVHSGITIEMQGIKPYVKGMDVILFNKACQAC